MTTKEQERKALAQIKKIVDGLGEDSYVGTALDGALDLAEENIDCDAAFSTRYYRYTLNETEEKLKAANLEIASLKKELTDNKKAYEQAYESVSSRLMCPDDLNALKKLLAEKTSELQRELDNAAARIVGSADDPSSAAFQNAVSDHRTAQKELDSYSNVLKSVIRMGETV